MMKRTFVVRDVVIGALLMGASALYGTHSLAQSPPAFTTGLQATCGGRLMEKPFSLQFQAADKDYEKQINDVLAITNSGECRLTPAAKSHLSNAIETSRKALKGDFYVAVKVMAFGGQQPWADIHLGEECLLMKGGDGYAYKTHYLTAVRDIDEYSAKLRKLPLSNLERLAIIARMDMINGRMAFCAAAGGDDITEELIDDSAFLVVTAQAVVDRELAGRRADSDHVIVSSQKGGGSAPPFFPKGLLKR